MKKKYLALSGLFVGAILLLAQTVELTSLQPAQLRGAPRVAIWVSDGLGRFMQATIGNNLSVDFTANPPTLNAAAAPAVSFEHVALANTGVRTYGMINGKQHLIVFVNGVAAQKDLDYTVSGNTLTLVAAYGDEIQLVSALVK